MKSNLEVQELTIIIVAKKYNPTILTADFLKYSGIIPGDWELGQTPILTNNTAQVVFQNGVNIIAESNRIIFSELIAAKEPQDVEIPAIATKYIKTLAQVDYQGIGINFRGHVLFDQQPNTARDYILKTLLNPGSWQELGQAPVQAAIRFLYTLDGAQMSLDINEAGLKMPDNKALPIVLFSANFNHTIAEDEPNQKMTNLEQVIDSWQTDLTIYKQVVNNKFLDLVGDQLNVPTDESIIPIATAR
jgi:hypothetical protein